MDRLRKEIASQPSARKWFGFCVGEGGQINAMSWYSAVCAPASLRHVLACCYTTTPTRPQRLVLDACLDLVSISDGSLWVCGPERRGWDFELPDGMESVGVRFRPGAAAAVLGISVSQLADRRWRVTKVLGYEAEQRLRVALRRTNRDHVDHRVADGVRAGQVSEIRRARTDPGDDRRSPRQPPSSARRNLRRRRSES